MCGITSQQAASGRYSQKRIDAAYRYQQAGIRNPGIDPIRWDQTKAGRAANTGSGQGALAGGGAAAQTQPSLLGSSADNTVASRRRRVSAGDSASGTESSVNAAGTTTLLGG